MLFAQSGAVHVAGWGLLFLLLSSAGDEHPVVADGEPPGAEELDRVGQKAPLGLLRHAAGKCLGRVVRQDDHRALVDDAAHAAVAVGKERGRAGELAAAREHRLAHVALDLLKGGIERGAGADDSVFELVGDHAQRYAVVGQQDKLDVHVLELVRHRHAVRRHRGKQIRIHHIGGNAGIQRPLHHIGVFFRRDHRDELEFRQLAEVHRVEDRLELYAVAGRKCSRSDHTLPSLALLTVSGYNGGEIFLTTLLYSLTRLRSSIG